MEREVMDGRDPEMSGAELRMIRTACGLNLADFGNVVGVVDKSVRGWENSNEYRIPTDVADRARDMYVDLMDTKQEILGQYADFEPGDEATMVLYRLSDFDGSVAEASIYNAAATLAFHTLVEDGIVMWIEWSS